MTIKHIIISAHVASSTVYSAYRVFDILLLSFLLRPLLPAVREHTYRRTSAAADHDPRTDRGRRLAAAVVVFVVVVVVVVVIVAVVVVVVDERRVDRHRAAGGDPRGRHTARRVKVHHHAVQGDARAGHRCPRPVRQGHTSGDGRHVQVLAKGRQVRGHRGHALRFRADPQRSRRPVLGTHLRLRSRSVCFILLV